MGLCPVHTYRTFSEYSFGLIDSQGTIRTTTLPLWTILHDTDKSPKHKPNTLLKHKRENLVPVAIIHNKFI